MGPPGDNVNTLYRSVPPRPHSYTFSDILQASLKARTTGSKISSRSKTAPVSTNLPEDYAERFKSRPTTRPSVIDFDGAGVKMFPTCRRFNAPSFPVVKTKNGGTVSAWPRSPEIPTQPMTERGTRCTTGLHLAPLGKRLEPDTALSFRTAYGAQPSQPIISSARSPQLTQFHGLPTLLSRHSAAKSSGSSGPAYSGDQHGKASGSWQPSSTTTAVSEMHHWQELSNSKLSTLDTKGFVISPRATGDNLGFPEALTRTDDFDDLSDLPRPSRILPKRDLPWVFRFKVKKEMNALSKIMASKPDSNGPLTPAGPVA